VSHTAANMASLLRRLRLRSGLAVRVAGLGTVVFVVLLLWSHYRSVKTMAASYSLWLQPPEGQLRRTLLSEIELLAADNPGAPRWVHDLCECYMHQSCACHMMSCHCTHNSQVCAACHAPW
jgi:hypothetical protein